MSECTTFKGVSTTYGNTNLHIIHSTPGHCALITILQNANTHSYWFQEILHSRPFLPSAKFCSTCGMWARSTVCTASGFLEVQTGCNTSLQSCSRCGLRRRGFDGCHVSTRWQMDQIRSHCSSDCVDFLSIRFGIVDFECIICMGEKYLY